MRSVAVVQSAMIAYFAGDIRRINHFLKVYALAKGLGELEELDEYTQETLEIAALTHDIGIRNSERKYQSSAGEYQQLEGPPEAQALLEALDVPTKQIERVCWLIAHHHTYHDIQGLDYQLLVEADFLVNIQEDQMSCSAIRRIESSIFRTSAGLDFLHRMYPLDEATSRD